MLRSRGGSSPTTARWTPTPSSGTSSNRVAPDEKAGPSASAEVEVTIPSRWARTMAPAHTRGQPVVVGVDDQPPRSSMAERVLG